MKPTIGIVAGAVALFAGALALCWYLTDKAAFERGRISGVAQGTSAAESRAKNLAMERQKLHEAEKETVRRDALEAGRLAEVERANNAAAEAERIRLADLAAAAARAKADKDALLAERGPSPYSKVKVLAVGINYEGSPFLTPLQYARQDATKTAELLRVQYEFTVEELIDAKATKAAILEKLREMLATLGKDDDFLFYFAGHGTTLFEPPLERTGLLLPYDAADTSSPNALQRERGIALRDLLKIMQESPGRHRLILLDSCFSGLPEMPEADKPAKRDPNNPLGHRSVQLLTAGAENERAIELPTISAGVFSHEIRRVISADGSGPQTLLSVFTAVREAVTRKSEYALAMQGRLGSPQHRNFMPASPGDFVFIQPKDYKGWKISQRLSADIQGYDIPVAESEYRTFLAKQTAPAPDTQDIPIVNELVKQFKLPAVLSIFEGAKQGASTPAVSAAPTAPAISPADLRRYEARASMGDPYALGILAAASGRTKDPLQQKRAREYAFAAYETGTKPGKAALGLAYAEGYSGQRDPALGGKLLEESGFKDAVPWISDFLLLAGGYAAIKSKNPQERIAGAVSLAVAGKGLIGRLLRKSPVDKVSDHLREVRKAVEPAQADFPKAIKELANATEAIVGEKELDTAAKAGLLSAIAAVKEACDKADRTATLQLIAEWFTNVEKAKR